jgi:hypothetical protein
MRLDATGGIFVAPGAGVGNPYEEGSLWLETGARDPLTGDPVRRPFGIHEPVQAGMRFCTYIQGRFVPIMHEDARAIIMEKTKR